MNTGDAYPIVFVAIYPGKRAIYIAGWLLDNLTSGFAAKFYVPDVYLHANRLKHTGFSPFLHPLGLLQGREYYEFMPGFRHQRPETPNTQISTDWSSPNHQRGTWNKLYDREGECPSRFRCNGARIGLCPSHFSMASLPVVRLKFGEN